jgi:putative transposase
MQWRVGRRTLQGLIQASDEDGSVPRFPRLVVPGYPHHVTQRGIRRQQTFFDDADYRMYIMLIKELKVQADVDVWAYCLMPNHVHLVVVPNKTQSLAKLFGQAHHRYARHVNAIHDWRGHLWQERFYSVVMDETHALAAMKYVELNPVRAGLCQRADDWPWSSVHGNLGSKSDDLLDRSVLRGVVADWECFLSQCEEPRLADSLRSQTSTGRPAGDDHFIHTLERKTGRRIRRRHPGRAPKI